LLRLALPLLLLLALVGCDGDKDASPRSPQAVVRAWSKALNAEDNERAANLFERGARVIQGGRVLRLDTHADAVEWNAGLPCSGHIVSLNVQGDTAEATFLLGPRGQSPCDGPGERVTALFTVRDGRIVTWHQLPPPEPGGGTI
jgi:hypothetical protein